MKKAIALMSIIIIFSACSASRIENSSVPERPNISASIESEYTLERGINESSNIVYGRILTKSPFDKGIDRYEVEILDEYKGKLSTDVLIIHASSNFIIETEYVLFLEYFESALYSGKVYKPLMYSNVTDGEILSFNIMDIEIIELGIEMAQINEIGKLNTYIEMVDNGKMTDKPNVVTRVIYPESIDELITDSEFISEVIPYEIIAENSVMKFVKCKVEKSYKGEMNQEVQMFLPVSANLNSEYLVFTFETDTGNYEVNSTLSFISKNDEAEYAAVIDRIFQE